jgi:hypothetical protein
VTMADGIELRPGLAGWMRWSHLAISLLGAAAILVSATSPWMKAALLAGLTAVHLASASHAQRTAAKVRVFRLFEDGTASLLTPDGRVPALLMDGAWTCRWFSVLRMRPLDGARLVRCTVARSDNTPGDYRRLLVLLRHRGSHDQAMRWNWL